jgi:hypothetical protein
MPEREEPKVVLRGPAEGDSIILPKVANARISRAKHPEPRPAVIGRSGRRGRTLASTTHRTPMMKQKPSTSLKVPTPSTPAPLRQRESDQAHSSSFRLAPSTGSEPVQKGGGYSASGRRPSKPRSSVDIRQARPTRSHAGRDGLSSCADLLLTGLPVLTLRRLVRADLHGIDKGLCR